MRRIWLKSWFKANLSILYFYAIDFKGVLTKGKTFSLAFFGPDKNTVSLFSLVQFSFTLQFSQKSTDLTTNPHVCKDRSIIGQNGLGRGNTINMEVSNHGAPGCCTHCAHHFFFIKVQAFAEYVLCSRSKPFSFILVLNIINALAFLCVLFSIYVFFLSWPKYQDDIASNYSSMANHDSC